MSVAQTVPAYFERRDEPGLAGSMVLAAAVHLLLFAILFLGVRWQNRPPEIVSVELWEPAPVVQPEPRVEPKVEPKPEPRVEPPPRPEVRIEKPEPRIEKPDITLKEPAPKKAVPKPEPKPAPKPVPQAKAVPKPKPEPPKPAPVAKPEAKAKPQPRDEEMQKRLREELAREQQSFSADRERQQVRDQLARDATAMRSKAIADWVDKVRAKIRGNVMLPLDLKGNPEAIFDVVQLPTGEVLSVKLRKSSGHKGYDEAVERAILKASPLPRPERQELFERSLELRFRPLD